VSKLIVEKLGTHNYDGATAIAVVMLAASFAIMLAINLLQWHVSQHGKKGA
jgi:sulfate transport system permease protein